MSLARYTTLSLPLIEAIAEWERENGTLAAIQPSEYEDLCIKLANVAVRGSARAALSEFYEDGSVDR